MPTPSLTPYATADDLALIWRQLTAAEEERANALLLTISNRLRSRALDLGFNLDDKITAETTGLLAANIKSVILEVAKRVMQIPTDDPAVETYAQTAGPYSANIKYTNPTGDIWFKKAELELIGLGGRQKLSSISTTTEDIYNDAQSI